MSDFDKEAERERLREKYEEDKQKREASERMSDLLLKGATMTNAHCNDCGDPIFRYDGDEFCPTCQRVVTNDEAVEEAAESEEQVDEPVQTPEGGTGADAEAGAEGSPATENGDTPDHIEVKQPDGPAVRTGADQSGTDQPTGGQPGDGRTADVGSATDRSDTRSTAEGSAGSERSEPEAGTAPTDLQPNASEPSHAQRQPADGRSAASPAQSGDGAAAPAAAGDDFGAARASLVRALRNHAERAENADDPRRARDHLAAAREAAEALGALSGSY